MEVAAQSYDALKRDRETRALHYLSLDTLRPSSTNARKHSRAQIRAIAKSIEAFGFNAPLLVDRNKTILAGHGRYEAARLLGLADVPVLLLEHLTEAQAKAYMLADNKLSDRSSWDDHLLAVQLKELSEIAQDFDITTTGFELPEIDIRIQSLDQPDTTDLADENWPALGPTVTVEGDLWQLGSHRLYCGDAFNQDVHDALLGDQRAAAVFTDPPYNLKIDGMVCGNGQITHREFAMATGEMSRAEYGDFLLKLLDAIRVRSEPGAVIYICMDWRHIEDLLAAGRAKQLELINVCVWSKSNAGLGSFYRSQHELIAVFKNGDAAHQNNVELGRFGRNRTNVWHYAGANSFPRKNAKKLLNLHPTVKPVRLVADAILDCTKPDELVLDLFLGSGTTILAAERTRRRCSGVEIDPRYVDVAIQRWQKLTGREARDRNGDTYASRAARCGAAQ
ncbi:site-specific DNA-methyltransferase [Bradyrhizobium sp. CCGB12]|uniref:site-specific DNA-methyltransferase n=1 Tax=Bradyrhizobium sp. CCGB12 TaxID=2949632 RepID=UPI0020B1809D|nr:site-specific DNA-methyltransferase [Bradyrhizobium sp. CCGB12]MCP3391756.1 site-specific DNA-methyltransferase [Bradyrhizobium sp. CCGB12]